MSASPADSNAPSLRAAASSSENSNRHNQAVKEHSSLVQSAKRLVQALAQNDNEEYRLALLQRVVKRLTDPEAGGYPMFLKLLLTVAESKDDRAKRTLAATLALGLKKMDLPSGSLTSWGGTSLASDSATISASALSGMVLAGAPKRQYGPVEYLTVWHSQSTQRGKLGAATYQRVLAALIELLEYSDLAKTLYPQKLLADAQNQLEGAYTKATRERLQCIAEHWLLREPPQKIAERAVRLN